MSDKDWDLGQRLIEQGACSLDQVREVLSLQDRMRKMGATPKPFARVLLEKGYARREQLLRAGVPERDLPAPLESQPLRVPTRPHPMVWVAVVLVLLGGLVFAGRGLLHRPEEAKPPDPALIEAGRREQLDRIGEAAKASSSFDNAPEVVRRYEEYKTVHAGTKWEVEAHRRLKEYRDRAELHAQAELDELLPGEAPLFERRRWSELVAHYRKFPEKFLETTEAGAAVKRKLRDFAQRLTEAYLKEKAEAVKFADEKKYSEALAAARALEGSAPADRKDEVLQLRARIERESRGAAERAREEVADAYFKVDGPYKQAMLLRDGFRAALVVREFITAPWKADQRPFVSVRGVDYDALLKAVEPFDPEKVAAICEAAIPEVDSPDRLGTGEGALLALRNAALMALFVRDQMAQFHAATSTKQPLELPGLGEGHFEKKENRTVFVTRVGEVLDPEAHPLQAPDLVALAMMVGPANAAMHLRVGIFYFYSAPDRVKEAYEHLARAYTLGARGVKLLLGGLAVAAESELRRELETKYGAAQDLYRNRNWKQVKKLLGDLLLYSEHPYTKSVRPEIEKILFEISEGTQKEKELSVKYLGRVEVLGEALRVTYDFEGNEQQDAFEAVAEEGPRKFKGRWRVDRGAMESSADASVMRWKTPLKGDVVLDYDLTPVEEAQNIAVNLYYNRGRATHYAVVAGFDWAGKQDGDRDNSVEDRFGMPRTCVIKYPVVVDKTRWQFGDAWDIWKSRLAGKPGAAWRPERGKTARMRIERLGSSIRVLADRTLVWEGSDAEYGEGQLLVYSDRRCRIDNLMITFKP